MTKLNKKVQKCDSSRDKTGVKLKALELPKLTGNGRLPGLPRISEVLSLQEQELLKEASSLVGFVNSKADENDR
jgi:hypothetical protein